MGGNLCLYDVICGCGHSDPLALCHKFCCARLSSAGVCGTDIGEDSVVMRPSKLTMSASLWVRPDASTPQ